MSGKLRTVAFLAMICAATPAAADPKPRLLKRHGIVYGIRDIGFQRNCKGMGVFDECNMYALSGTVVSIEWDPRTDRIADFVLRTAGGRTKMQNIEKDFPVAAEGLLRVGRRVRVSGIMTGQMQVAFPSEIIAERLR